MLMIGSKCLACKVIVNLKVSKNYIGETVQASAKCEVLSSQEFIFCVW